MISDFQLRRWLAREILQKDIGRKPPAPERNGPPKDWKYRAWIRSFPCAVCGCLRFIEAAHTGPHAFSQKSSDYNCIPLCAVHHRIARDALHVIGPEKFSKVHGISIRGLIQRLNRLWVMGKKEIA
jgi:hypothetical protein